MVYLDRPFKVGDWIRSPDKEIEGTVEEIGWRQTRIRTFSKRPIYVPNSIFMNIIVENPSRMSHRRIYETMGLRYKDISVVNDIVKEVKQMLLSHKEIDTNQTMIVNFNEFSESSVDFFIYTFTKTTNWVRFHEVKHEVLLKVYEIVEKHDADLAFPTRVLQVENNDTSLLTQS
jgi:MscS family membrane protein